MSGRAKELFDQLTSAEAILALIGQSEDAHLECKEWPAKDVDVQKVLAKAACGLTNAEGGVILFGMNARTILKDEPDLIDSAAPVADTSAAKSRILDLIGQLVEPGIKGIQAREVNEPTDAKSGFVVVYVPESEGSPRRSRKDWKFYLRIGSGTFPMEYFQIEERFGKRPSPKLELYLESEGAERSHYAPREPARIFTLGIPNRGFGIAKFPSIRYRRASTLIVSHFGLDGCGGFGLPPRPSENAWAAFRGGMDDVIYPDDTRKITRLVQHAESLGQSIQQRTPYLFKAVKFECEISCEGIPTITVEKSLPEESILWS